MVVCGIHTMEPTLSFFGCCSVSHVVFISNLALGSLLCLFVGFSLVVSVFRPSFIFFSVDYFVSVLVASLSD